MQTLTNSLRKISQEEVDLIIDQHKTWLINSERGERAHLENLDLTGLSLIGRDLSHASIVDCDLSGVDLSRSNLTRAKLTGSILYKTNLQRAILIETDFYFSKAEGALFKGAIWDRTTKTNSTQDT